MSKKRDPLSLIINYFTTAPLAEIDRAATIVREIVRSRQPVAAATLPGKAAPRKRPSRRKTPLPGTPVTVTAAAGANGPLAPL